MCISPLAKSARSPLVSSLPTKVLLEVGAGGPWKWIMNLSEPSRCLGNRKAGGHDPWEWRAIARHCEIHLSPGEEKPPGQGSHREDSVSDWHG